MQERIGLLGEPAKRALRAYLEDGRPDLLEHRSPGDQLPAEVFLNHHGAPLGVRGLRYRLDRIRRLAGLPAGEQASVTLRVGRCPAGESVTVTLDPGEAVAEAVEDDNAVTVACPV